MPLRLAFKKSGKQIKEAIAGRLEKLGARLQKRNGELDAFMDNRAKLRSYLVRLGESSWSLHTARANGKPAPLYSKEDISSEEKEEVKQLCQRIFEIEQEMRRLELIRTHLEDDREFELPYEDLVSYGFESEITHD
ncbi:MAG: hypothetical protein AAF624_12385 [Bacteroidota bacterium]